MGKVQTGILGSVVSYAMKFYGILKLLIYTEMCKWRLTII
ncbi:hypothetical protein BA6E_121429 [Bacteroidales bacterium 6E]|nr:hypothetical protein BA6E_121429 [Bacteroidales bacterium 6E]